MSTINSNAIGSTLKQEVAHAVSAVQSTCMDLLAVLAPIQRATDLQRVLGIDYKISWKIMRIAEANDLLAVAFEVPRPGSMARLLKAAATKGVSQEILNRLAESIHNFDSMATRHGGDRQTFDAMVSAFSEDVASDRLVLEAKRSMYRAAMQLFGQQVDTRVSCFIVRPNAHDKNFHDLVWVTANLGLKRFHRSAPLRVHGSFFQLNDSVQNNTWVIDQDHDQKINSSTILLKKFSSKPFPSVQIADNPEMPGAKILEFETNEIGLQSAVDCVLAQVIQTTAPIENELGEKVVISEVAVAKPTGVLLMDFFIHEDIVLDSVPECKVLSRFTPGQFAPDNFDSAGLLSAQEQVGVIGRGVRAARCKELPWYDELLQHVFGKMGWDDADRFQMVRCRVEYPVMGSTILVRVPVV